MVSQLQVEMHFHILILYLRQKSVDFGTSSPTGKPLGSNCERLVADEEPHIKHVTHTKLLCFHVIVSLRD